MKSALLALAVAGSAVAQNLSGEPPCATACLTSAISRAGCAPDDMACQCGPTQSAIASYVAPCLVTSCTGADLGQAASAGLALCSMYSATAKPNNATVTTTTSTGSGSGAATATTTSTSAGATTKAGGNSTVTTGKVTSTTTAGAKTSTSSSKTAASTNAAATLGAGLVAALVGVMAAAL